MSILPRCGRRAFVALRNPGDRPTQSLSIPSRGFPSLRRLPSPPPRGWIAPLVVTSCLAFCEVAALWSHKAMLGRAESVEAAWARVESTLQRRADLVLR